jgi:hypothetical protein
LDFEQLRQLPHISSIDEATQPNTAYILKRPEKE